MRRIGLKHFTDIISIAMDMENYRFTCIWHDLMVSSAAICFSGVTPAQPEESTEILTSGINALRSSAFDTTQISVQSPTSSISIGSSSFIFLAVSASFTEPNVGFQKYDPQGSALISHPLSAIQVSL